MKRLILMLSLLSLFADAGFAAKRAFTIEDLYRVKNVGQVDISPDGRTIAYVVTTSDLPRAKRRSQIWVMDRDGRNQRQLTQGDASSSSPQFAPDGKSLVFMRGGKLMSLPLAGGEPKTLASVSTGISDPIFSQDGTKIAFASDVYPECGADDACNKRISERWAAGSLKAHMADSLLYRHWTAWKDGTNTHTLVLDVASGKITDVTPGTFDAPTFQLGGPVQYDFSPDGKELVFVSNRGENLASSTNNDLWIVSLVADKPTPRNITASNHAYDGSPKYSPDGKYIAYRRQATPGYEADVFRLALYDRATGQTRILTESFDNWVDDYYWAPDSKTIYFTGGVRGINPIFRLDIATGAITQIYSDATIDEFIISDDGSSMIYVSRSVGEPQELYGVTLPNGKRSALTSLNRDLMNEVDIRPAEEMWVEGANGAKIHTFIVKPHNFDPKRKYPAIINVHGGPQSMWGNAFRGDWQVYPGAGYVVAFPNPHGSTGYGQAFTAQISGEWGGAVYEDVMKVTDAVERLPYVDANRIGAMGWSYGGYMMNWILGHTDRYEAIASMMGLFDLRSFYGATEELWFPEWDLKGQPWNSALYEKWSPSNYVQNFKTPTLVIAGERDYRVPYTQSLQLFTALQKMNVPSRLIIYSDAGHWPNWYEMALYYTAHLEWFQKYLGGGGAPWTTEAFLRNAVFDPATGERYDEEKPEVPDKEGQARKNADQNRTPKNTQGKPKPRG